ncbi:MAG: type 2 isopentenyl-diphosphate Delta-isomerase [Candidatus Marinimicrobia bacterium]|nr:type 2 isopentenyl-diphosphate Delta-isomerase [Candidatus Neomarinimicrobiota bacterium]MBT3631687.1 type 2 isopentenyl-diphosphate Delta-isomerase [Candidatus Neomarinimicrobiota bacterium]MBT3825888.1 type 2 isopentenyl-diphosphate Delta-isomerase [Candidatus Neomarinimicrobiota bacterium]MBT4129985.1 type 2 isopentenyl-diphosphate Delta-isomerase [Candidatus Neomarinimicrobiota bacterium]MBT4296029.1 type 2 isopentenyl-diphosphate Delta-isomerase [Candidatus Neomarinimicrobiota bacterium
MTTDIEQRKRDHLNLAQDEALNFSISAGFDRWRFIHNALPELNLSDVDTRTIFLGKELQFPLLISSMSGGVKESFNFNATLASAAEEVGCALALGSIRVALENESVRDSFLIAREKAPTAIIMANLGIAQIMSSQSIDRVATFCDDLKANALIIHLNSLQEAFQPEGDTQFEGALKAIETWVCEFPLPVVIKEVGQGLSLGVIARLKDVGVEIIDIAGAGGSNWISIERERLSDDQVILKQTAEEFANWGEPTAEILENLATDQFVIASGGLKQSLDLAKAIALGANMGGVAGVLLRQALKADTAGLSEVLLVWKRTLEMAMFGVGVRTIDELKGNRSLLHKIG